MGLNLCMVIGFHLVGAIITLIIDYKNGTFEQAAKHGDGIRSATPSDVVFNALVLWEFELLLFIFDSIGYVIDKFFRNRYEKRL